MLLFIKVHGYDMRELQYKLYLFFRETFQFSLVVYLVLFIAETLKSGFVSMFLNLNIILGIVIFSGIGMILLENQNLILVKKKPITSENIQNCLLLSFLGGLFIFSETNTLGLLTIILSVLAGLLLFLTALLLLVDDNNK